MKNCSNQILFRRAVWEGICQRYDEELAMSEESAACSETHRLKMFRILRLHGEKANGMVLRKRALIAILIAAALLLAGCTVYAFREVLFSFVEDGFYDSTGSVGFEYVSNPDGRTCRITGIGDCTDQELIIPAYIEPYVVTEIADEAFVQCRELTSVYIPDTVTRIGFMAFDGCSELTSVRFSENLVEIDDYGFLSCPKLTDVTLPEGLKTIGEYAFSGCYALTSIVIPDSVTTVGQHAFNNCNYLTSVRLSANMEEIPLQMFYRCFSLTEVIIPEGVRYIHSYAFYECSALESVELPESMVALHDNAFGFCKNLKTVTVSAGIKSIGWAIFAQNKDFETIRFKGTMAQWRSIEINPHNGVFDVVCTDGTLKFNQGEYRE